MAYTTLAEGGSAVIQINDQFDGLEVINRSQDLATVALTTGSWAYGSTPQQHSGRRVYQLRGPGSITLTASSGSCQYELTDAADNRVADSFSVSETSGIRSLVSGAGNLTINTRDGMGRVTSYVDSAGTTWTVTYGDDGPATVSGGGNTRTFNYTAGLLTGYTAS